MTGSFNQVLINNQEIDATDWVVAFNEDICVGAKQWDCISSSCDLPVYGENNLNSSQIFMIMVGIFFLSTFIVSV